MNLRSIMSLMTMKSVFLVFQFLTVEPLLPVFTVLVCFFLDIFQFLTLRRPIAVLIFSLYLHFLSSGYMSNTFYLYISLK